MASGSQSGDQTSIDNIDFDSQEFKDGINELAKMLKVPQHPDHLVTLKAISVLIKNLTEQKSDKQENKTTTKQCKELSIESIPLGFETGDKVLDHAAKVLRLSFINDLRELQMKINQMLVHSQSITANPKTNSSLGKVGR